jgi:LacI family transcriptional regulator
MMSTQARLNGCRSALAAASPKARLTQLMFGDYSVEHGRRAAEALIERQDATTAVFAASDEIAIGALEVFAREGLRIPDQLSIIGFDDVAPFHLFNPPLTCVRQPVDMMGRRAVEVLVSGLADGEFKSTVDCLPVDLMMRGSVASPARARKRNLPLSKGVDDVQSSGP